MFVFSLLVSCAETKEVRREETKESNASIKIQEIGLEVMTKDLGKMIWEDAMGACADLGDGWRLPTKDELEKIYKYRDKIGGFASNYYYWSSTEYGNDFAWYFNFGDGSMFNYSKSYAYYKSDTYYVRAVRDLK